MDSDFYRIKLKMISHQWLLKVKKQIECKETDFLDFFLKKKNRHWEITEVGAGATEMVGAGATGKSLWLRIPGTYN